MTLWVPLAFSLVFNTTLGFTLYRTEARLAGWRELYFCLKKLAWVQQPDGTFKKMTGVR